MAGGNGFLSLVSAAITRAIENLKYYVDTTADSLTESLASKSHEHTGTEVSINGKTLDAMLEDGTLQGKSAYVHIRWKSSETSTTLLETPSTYIGIVSNNNPTAPTTTSAYSWYKYKGDDGIIGKDGEPGEPGSQILSSESDPSASNGRVGDWYINRDSFDIFEKTADNTWTNRGNLRGKDNIGGGIIYDGRVIVAPIFASIDEETGAMTFDPDGDYLLSQDINGNIIFREYFKRAPSQSD